MRMDKLTSKFQMALADAQSLAVGQDHQFIEPAHVMVALLDQQGGSMRGLLTKSGMNVNLLRSQLGDAIDRLAKVEGSGGDIHISNPLGKLLNITDKLAQKRDDQFISSELFALAAIDTQSPLRDVMQQAGGVHGAIEKAVEDLRGGQPVNDPNAEEARQAQAVTVLHVFNGFDYFPVTQYFRECVGEGFAVNKYFLIAVLERDLQFSQLLPLK